MRNLLILLLLLSISIPSFSQTKELTSVECQIKLDSIYKNFKNKKQIKERSKLSLTHPNNETSLKDLYYLRNKIDKVVLRHTLNKLSIENKSSKYAKSLDQFINTRQIKKGDQYLDFNGMTSTGENFILSDILKQKNVLLIIEGLDCMGESGRQSIRDLYKDLDLNRVEVISFSIVENKEQLKKQIDKFDMTWMAVSDFEGIASEPWLAYVDKGTPTTVYINSNGKVLAKGPGLINKAMKLARKHKKD